MNDTDDSETKRSIIERLRHNYLMGQSIPDILRSDIAFKDATAVDMMFLFMEAFHLSLGDVSCLDGWWPPISEVTDENLDLFIRDAIEAHQAEWKSGSSQSSFPDN